MRESWLILGIACTLTACAAAGDEDYKLGPDSQVQPGVPQGKVTKHTWKSEVFAGTERTWQLYVPAQYDGKTPICVMVFQDGSNYANPKGPFRVPVVLNNLIHRGELPPMAALFIDPGQFPAAKDGEKPKSNRSVEYDTLSPDYVTFLEKEMLPEAEKLVKLRQDAAGRGIGGISSGGICAFTAAWERPDLFRKVLSHVGSFTDIRGGHAYPSMIRKTTPAKPIRVFLQGGENDLNNRFGHWPLANRQMDAALRFAKYDHQFVMGTGKHSGVHGGAILPESLKWLWRDEVKK